MGTNYVAPTWRQPENTNKDKLSNYSIDTAGTSVGIDCGSMADLFGTASVTYNTSYSIWIKPEFNYNDTTYQTFFGNFSSGNNALLLYYATDIDAWKFAVGDGSGHNYVASATITSNEELGKGEWQHHCVVFDTVNNNAYYYINNQQVNSSTSLNKKIATNADFYIGKKWDLTSGVGLTGQLSQACIFDYALSTDQRTYLYNLNNPMAISGAEPIAYWPLGDNSNPTTTAGYPNISVGADSVFDFIASGPDQIVTKKFSNFNISTEFSFSTWVNFDSESSWDHVIGNPSGGNWGDGFGLYLNGSGIVFWVGKYNGSDNSGNPTFVASGNTDIHPNRWYHITCTYSNSAGGKMYINSSDYGGVEKTFTFSGDASDSTNAPWINTTNITIGTVNNNATYAIDGKVSNVQIWNKKLSDADAVTLWNNGQPLMTGTQPQAANLKAWYKLNQSANWNGSNWAISDSTANYTKVLSRIASYNTVTSAGSADRVNCGNDSSLQITGSMSISLWFRVNTISPLHSWNFVMGRSRYRTEAAADAVWNLLLKGVSYGNPAFFQFRLSDGTTVTNYEITETTNGDYFNNQWQNLTITYDGTTNVNSIKAYLNGNLHQQFTSSQTGINNVAARNLTFYDNDVYSYGDPAYTGALSNCAIWNSELSASDVTTIWNGGKAADTIPSTNLQGWWKFSDGTYGSPNTYWTFPDSSSNSNTGVTGTYGSAATFFTEDSVKTDYVSALNGTSSGMNTTNLVQSNLTRTQPFSSYSVQFDGALDWFDIGNVKPSTTSLSISAWAYKTDTSQASIIGRGASVDYGIFVYGGSLQFGLNSGSWTTITTTIPTVNTWFHVCATWDGSDMKLYVDGVLASSASKTGTITYTSNNTTIGKNSTLSGFEWDGKISNVALFSSAISQDDVLNLYNNGIPQDLNNFRITPTNWYPMDQSYTYFNGSVLVARDVINGNDGTGANVIQENIVGDAPGSDANGTGANLTIADLKGDMKSSINNSYSINMADYADGVTNPADSGRSTNVP